MLAATTSTTSRCTRGARDFGEGPAEARGLRASSGGGEEGRRVGGGAPLVAGVHGISERAVKTKVALPSPSILSVPSEVIALLKKVNQA